MTVYGKVGYSGEYCMAPHLAAEHGCIEMQSVPPSCDAIAQADGTWFVPPNPDLTLGEVENLVGMFPLSYGYVLEKLGFGDVV